MKKHYSFAKDCPCCGKPIFFHIPIELFNETNVEKINRRIKLQKIEDVNK